MTDELINAILEIVNHKRIKDYLEPNICWHEDLRPNLVKRVLYSYFLLMEAKNLYTNAGGTIPETDLPDAGTIHSDP